MVVTNACSPDPRVQRHARWLVDAGHEVTIHAFDRLQAYTDEEIDGYKVIRHHLGISKYGGGFSTLRAKRKFIRSLQLKDDIVICNDSDTLALKFKGKRIFDMHDLAYTWPLMQGNGIRNKIMSWWMKKDMLRRAKTCDIIITSSPGFVKWLKKHNLSAKLVLNSREPIACERITDKIVVGYFGRIRETEPFLLLQSAIRNENVKVIIAGDGPKVEEVCKNFPDADYRGKFSEEQLTELMKEITVMFAMYNPTRENITQGALPVKMFDAAAHNRSTIVNADTPMGDYCLENKLGLTARWGDSENLLEAITKGSKMEPNQSTNVKSASTLTKIIDDLLL